MKEIICSECHQANPGSSKFCNHCGNPLPPPDSIICPNCNASNPKKTYYCDECGTRLVTDKLGSGVLPSEEPAVDEPSDFFSLPVRKPGDIAEFDPADLSNWLEDETGDSPLMPTEGTGALGTGGLPDWLINESNPILNVPEEITTEHYNLLVDTDENLPALPPQVDVNLPDWLTDVRATDDAASDTPTGTAVPDWMPTPETDPESPKISGTTVADLSESGTASEFDFEDLFDFDDPESTASEPPPTANDLSVAETAIDEDDWLNVLTDDGDVLLAEETAVSPTTPVADTEFAIDEDDWLNVLMDDGDESAAEETAVSPPDLAAGTAEFSDWLAGDTTTESESAPDEDDWLNTLTDDADAPAPPDLADDTAAEAAPAIDDEDWLHALIDDEDDALLAEETAVVSDDLPDITAAMTDSPVDDGGDWLADLGEGGTELFDSSMPGDEEASLDWLDDDATTDGGDFDEELDDLFAGTELVGDDSLDWLAVEDDTNDESPSVSADDLFAAGTAAVGTGDLWLADADDAGIEDEPDWLAEYATESLAPAGEDALPVIDEPFEPAPLADDDLEDFFSAATDDTSADLFGDGEAAFTAADSTELDTDEFSLEVTEQDISFATKMLGGDGDGGDDEFGWVGDSTADVDADLPDWLDDLGEADDADGDVDAETAVSAAAVANEVPAWLADMAPGSIESEGGLSLTETSAGLTTDDDFDSITFDENELSDAGLPEWLHEDATSDDSTLAPSVAAGLAVAGTVFSDGDIIDDLLDGEDDFAGIDLSDLPPSIPLEERLAKARVPDWIEEMKPAEGGEPEPDLIPESAGPLVGIGGVIALQSALSPSYDASASVNQFAVTKEHQQQTALLRQLTHGERKLSSGMTQSDAKTSARVRMALIIALLLVALVGLFGPSLVSLPTEPSPALVAVHDELTAVSNQPVLIAFEYTPAMAGELNAQAETLLATLAENGSPAIVVSQSAAGSTIAASHLPEEGMQIGMVTGGAVGLRQLADCVGETAVCTTLLGREVTPDEQEILRDVALIIVLTGERDSMVNWIEQVGAPSGLPVVAGLTASIAPLAAPYYDSGQIGGMMVGLQETAVYQQEWQAQADDNILSRLNAQALLQLTAALLLVAGGLYYGVLKAKKNKKVGN